MPSIREVARTAGVSIATVSRVMNGAESVTPDLRDKVMQAVESCDYAPKVGRRSLDSIALVYTGPFTIGSPYDSACVDGMVEAMRETDFDLAVVDVIRDRSPGETLRQLFARKGIRGAIIRCTTAEREVVAKWAREELPLVVLGDHFECEQLSFVYADSSLASRQAVEHLVSMGHTRVAFAACERDDGDHLDRLTAYREVMRECGLLDEHLVCRVPPHRLDGAQLLRHVLGMNDRPTAMYIADPLVAVGAINEAHRLGVRVPDDLSIVGFDDTDIRSAVHPKMSAVCQETTQLGKAAFECVVRKIADPSANEPSATVSKAWLELNETTGPPPEIVERVLPTGDRLASS